jgi:hypothetical protein
VGPTVQFGSNFQVVEAEAEAEGHDKLEDHVSLLRVYDYDARFDD